MQDLKYIARCFGRRGDEDVVEYEKFCEAIKERSSSSVSSSLSNGSGDFKVDQFVRRLRRHFHGRRGTKSAKQSEFVRACRDYDDRRDGFISARKLLAVLEDLGVSSLLKESQLPKLFSFFPSKNDRRSVSYNDLIMFVLHGEFDPQADSKKTVGAFPTSDSEESSHSDGDGDRSFSSAFDRVKDKLGRLYPPPAQQKKLHRLLRDELDQNCHKNGTMKLSTFASVFEKLGLRLKSHELAQLQRQFACERNSHIDFDSVYRSIKSKGNQQPSQSQNRMLAAERPFDVMSSAVLQRLKASIDEGLTRGRSLWDLCAACDRHTTGYITTQEFSHCCKMLGTHSVIQQDIQAVVEMLEPDSYPGKVNYQQLWQLMSAAAPSSQNLQNITLSDISATPIHAHPAQTPFMARTQPFHPQAPFTSPRHGAGSTLQHGIPPPMAAPSPLQMFNSVNTLPRNTVDPRSMGTYSETNWIDPLLRQRMREKVLHFGPDLDLLQHFETLDPMRDGVVSHHKFHGVLQQLGILLPQSDLRDLLAALDPGHSGLVNYQRFVTVFKLDEEEMAELGKRIGRRLEDISRDGVNARETFTMFDMSDSGFITIREFRESVRQLGLPVTEATLNGLMFRFAQYKNSGNVAYNLFLQFLNDFCSINLGVVAPVRPVSPSRATSTTKSHSTRVNGDGFDGLMQSSNPLRLDGTGGVPGDVFEDQHVDEWCVFGDI
jgi:Ca2+-binding EF-hand superfamily protein